jgi:hypothetical protein
MVPDYFMIATLLLLLMLIDFDIAFEMAKFVDGFVILPLLAAFVQISIRSETRTQRGQAV